MFDHAYFSREASRGGRGIGERLRMQLKKNSKKLSWITVLLLLQKSPYLPIAKNLTSILAEKVWTWKMVIPTAVSSAIILSGATTYVTTSDSNPSSGNEGDDFSFSFYNHGHKAFSYKVENLPDGLTFNNNINGPKNNRHPALRH